VAFIFLGLHLAHGFTSAFQSVGAASLRKKLEKVGVAYSVLVPFGFIFIALYHFFNH
jgi:succinate dehydrogenase / fumarate reductase cytochrome b subunit